MKQVKHIKLSPNMMNADIGALTDTLALFEKHGIDHLHINIMDGIFAPGFMLGIDYCRQLRSLTGIPLDFHFLVVDPEPKIAWFEPRPGDYVSIHAESTKHLHRAIQNVKETGAKALVALNMATPLSAIEYVMEDIAGASLMLVNPGYGDQSYNPDSLRKFRDLRALANARGLEKFEIQADGIITFDNMADIVDAGADFIVLGPSTAFSKSIPPDEAMLKIKAIVGRK